MSDEVMNFDTVDKYLMKEFPELKPFYEKELRQWHEWNEGELDAFTVFGDVLNPYFVNLLKINEDKDVINRIFDFLEKMATCDDDSVKELLLEFSVLKELAKDNTILTNSKEYMGKETKRI